MDDKCNVIEIGDFSLEHKRRESHECDHQNIVVYSNDEIVKCRDCDLQLTPFFALKQLIGRWQDICVHLRRRETTIKQHEDSQVALRAAKKVEKVWRKHNRMAVLCPHCREGILPDDGLGDHTMAAEIALARRNRHN